MIMDRCDFPALWFLFSSDGRPFMYSVGDTDLSKRILAGERRRNLGSSLERRSGNHAAATVDEMIKSWPRDRMTVAEDGSFVHCEPYDLLEV